MRAGVKIATPGFESNRRHLNQPVTFTVRFVQQLPAQPSGVKAAVVADRGLNGLNLARAYLGDRAVLAVKVDPDSPNRQVTLLHGDRQLVSIITGRATGILGNGEFITTEVFQQQFQGTSRP